MLGDQRGTRQTRSLSPKTLRPLEGTDQQEVTVMAPMALSLPPKSTLVA